MSIINSVRLVKLSPEVEFEDEFFKSTDPLHLFVNELELSAEQVRKGTTDVDALVLRLEKDALAAKSK